MKRLRNDRFTPKTARRAAVTEMGNEAVWPRPASDLLGSSPGSSPNPAHIYIGLGLFSSACTGSYFALCM
jgi:hypothetical protein